MSNDQNSIKDLKSKIETIEKKNKNESRPKKEKALNFGFKIRSKPRFVTSFPCWIL